MDHEARVRRHHLDHAADRFRPQPRIQRMHALVGRKLDLIAIQHQQRRIPERHDLHLIVLIHRLLPLPNLTGYCVIIYRVLRNYQNLNITFCPAADYDLFRYLCNKQ